MHSKRKQIPQLHHSKVIALKGWTVDAPYSGAPYMQPEPVQNLPNPLKTTTEDPPRWINIEQSGMYKKQKGNAAACTAHKDKGSCLGDGARECMFVMTTTVDVTRPIQKIENHCMPCSVDEQPVPCWNVGAIVGGKKVLDCEMQCPHQLKVREPEYTCSNSLGFISQNDCYAMGTRSGSKCMHISLKKGGETKTQCAPCVVKGTGSWSCPENGVDLGGGWKVSGCASMCASPCTGPPNCPTPLVPPPLPGFPAPGLGRTTADAGEMMSAPAPYPIPTASPYAAGLAAQEAARAMGWNIIPPAAPKVYYPVVMYRKPVDYIGQPLPNALSYQATAPGSWQPPIASLLQKKRKGKVADRKEEK